MSLSAIQFNSNRPPVTTGQIPIYTSPSSQVQSQYALNQALLFASAPSEQEQDQGLFSKLKHFVKSILGGEHHEAEHFTSVDEVIKELKNVDLCCGTNKEFLHGWLKTVFANAPFTNETFAVIAHAIPKLHWLYEGKSRLFADSVAAFSIGVDATNEGIKDGIISGILMAIGLGTITVIIPARFIPFINHSADNLIKGGARLLQKHAPSIAKSIQNAVYSLIPSLKGKPLQEILNSAPIKLAEGAGAVGLLEIAAHIWEGLIPHLNHLIAKYPLALIIGFIKAVTGYDLDAAMHNKKPDPNN